MTSSKKILDDLLNAIKSIPKNPVTQLDEVNTILHIYAVKEEIAKSIDEKYKEDCTQLLKELEIHYQELSRKSDNKWLAYSPLEDLINEDCERTVCRFNF